MAVVCCDGCGRDTGNSSGLCDDCDPPGRDRPVPNEYRELPLDDEDGDDADVPVVRHPYHGRLTRDDV